MKTTKTAAKVEKKTNPVKVEKVERDAFGNRRGTSAAHINAVLLASKKPMTVKEVTEKANEKNTRNHLRYLVVKGFAVNNGGGYSVKKGKVSKAA